MDFIVMDDGNPIWDDKKETTKKFPTAKAAEKAAHILATCNPGKPIEIYRLFSTSAASVGAVKTKKL